MDRNIIYREEVPAEGDLLGAQRFIYEAVGLLAADLFGTATAVARLACTPTSPASLSVNVGPGSCYKFMPLDATPIGQLLGTGGLPADTATDHYIMKQGLLRDAQTFAFTPPVTTGQSIVYLIEAQFQEADDAPTASQFYNPANPSAPITSSVSPNRRDICALQVKAGTAATTGTQVCPGADAGWVPVWAVTVAHGATTIGSGQIATAPSAPFVAVGGGGGGGTTNWTGIATTYTATAGDKLIPDTTAGAFTVSLPPAPVADSSTVRIKGNFATHNLTIAGNGHNIDTGVLGLVTSYVLNRDGEDVLMVFDGTNWRP